MLGVLLPSLAQPTNGMEQGEGENTLNKQNLSFALKSNQIIVKSFRSLEFLNSDAVDTRS